MIHQNRRRLGRIARNLLDAGPETARARNAARRRALNLKHAALLCCSLTLALLMSGCGEKSLVTVPTESEAIEIVTILRQNGIGAEKEESGESSARQWNVLVNKSDYDLSNQFLQYYELPHVEKKKDEAVLPPVGTDKPDVAESEKEIERHLRKLNGVARVSVKISPAQDDTRMNPYLAKADVIITHKDEQPPVSEDKIKEIVASSFPTLKPETVHVTLQYKAPPAAPRREAGLDPRSYFIFAVGLVALALLSGLLIFLLRKTRRQRRRLAATGEPVEQPVEDAEIDEERQLLSPTTRSSEG